MKYQLYQVKHSTGVATLVGEADSINDLVFWADKVAYTDNYTWDVELEGEPPTVNDIKQGKESDWHFVVDGRRERVYFGVCTLMSYV